MATKLTSTKAKVPAPEEVRNILQDYDYKGVEIKLTKRKGSVTLKISFEETQPDYWQWPSALHRRFWPSEYLDLDLDDPEANKVFDLMYDLHEKHGAKGFLALLHELGPHLETQLVILVVCSEWSKSWGRVWIVHPGGAVETLNVFL